MARREPARGSWFAAVLGLGVLAAVAFFVGALAGLVWKEPGLLLAYVRGDTAEIAWSTASAEVVAAGPPPVAGAPENAAAEKLAAAKKPAREKTRSTEVKRAPARKPPAPTPPAVAAAPSAHIAVQVGAFTERAAADKLRASLREGGFPAYLAASAGGDEHWRVRVGPYASRPEAEKAADRLARARKLPTWILDEDAESP